VAAVALALGSVLLFSLVTLALFFAVGGPFGALNDWSIGVSGVVAAAFVLAIRSSGLGDASVSGVLLPAVAVAVASGRRGCLARNLDTTGFLLAGVVESCSASSALGSSPEQVDGVLRPWPRTLPTWATRAGSLIVPA
jgi:hypothetical protein